MPVKDTAREAAFAAMGATRDEIARVCRDIDDDSAMDPQRTADRLRPLLTASGFEVEPGVAGMPAAFRAAKRRLDVDAMRKGLRHGEVAFLVPLAPGAGTGLVAVLGAAIGLSASFEEEFGTVTVIGYPDDAALVAMTRAEIFDEFDAVYGARPAAPGAGYCYTIDGTGETLASRTANVSITGDAAPFIEAITTEASMLNAPDAIAVEVQPDGIVLTLTGRTSVELRDLSAKLQRLVVETPGGDVTFGKSIDDMLVSRILARRVKTYADTLMYKMDKIVKSEPAAASGWGNVSHVVPTFLLHFPLAIAPGTTDGSSLAPGSPESYARAFQFAECLCMAGVDVLRDMEYRAIADDQLVKALAKRGISRPHRRWLGVHPVIKTPGADEKHGRKGPKLADFRMVRGPGMRDN